jgi:hypothetical protein
MIDEFSSIMHVERRVAATSARRQQKWDWVTRAYGASFNSNAGNDKGSILKTHRQSVIPACRCATGDFIRNKGRVEA